jgi:hypothetical protein
VPRGRNGGGAGGWLGGEEENGKGGLHMATDAAKGAGVIAGKVGCGVASRGGASLQRLVYYIISASFRSASPEDMLRCGIAFAA